MCKTTRRVPGLTIPFLALRNASLRVSRSRGLACAESRDASSASCDAMQSIRGKLTHLLASDARKARPTQCSLARLARPCPVRPPCPWALCGVCCRAGTGGITLFLAIHATRFLYRAFRAVLCECPSPRNTEHANQDQDAGDSLSRAHKRTYSSVVGLAGRGGMGPRVCWNMNF